MRKCRFETVGKLDKTKSFQEGFDEFIRDCNARNLSKYTMRNYETLRYVLKCYCNMNDTSFNNIDKTFYEDFIIFLKETNIKDTTIVSYTKAFRTVLYFLWIENILKNLRLLFQKQIFL